MWFKLIQLWLSTSTGDLEVGLQDEISRLFIEGFSISKDFLRVGGQDEKEKRGQKGSVSLPSRNRHDAYVI